MNTQSLQSERDAKETMQQQFESEKEDLGTIKAQDDIIEKLELTNQKQNSEIDEHQAQVSKLEQSLAESSQESESRLNDLKENLNQETEQLKEKVQAQEALISDEAAINQELKDKLAAIENTQQGDLDPSRSYAVTEMQDTALNREQQRKTNLVNRIEKDSQQARGAYESIRSENIELTDRVESLKQK